MAELETLMKCKGRLELVLNSDDVLLYLQDEVEYPRQLTPVERVTEIRRLVEKDPQRYHFLLDYLKQQGEQLTVRDLEREYARRSKLNSKASSSCQAGRPII